MVYFFDSRCSSDRNAYLIIIALIIIIIIMTVMMMTPRDAVAVLVGSKFADNIHYKFKSSQASKTRLQSSKHTGAKQNLTQNSQSRSFKVLESVERR